MILSFHPCFDADRQIILGDRPLASPDLSLIRKAEAVILPQARSDDLYRACAEADVPVFPDYALRAAYPGKVGQSLLFERFRCPRPETLRWRSVESFRALHPVLERCPHGVPFLFKADHGHEGEGVYYVDTEPAWEIALACLSRRETPVSTGFITQEYIPGGGNVLRAVIIGTRVLTYWKRPDAPGRTVTTIRRGAGIDHEWRPELQKKGKREVLGFARSTGINLAAVDLVFPLNRTVPDALFLEINYYFGRRGLGGSVAFYRVVLAAVREWLQGLGLPPAAVRMG